MKSKIADIEIQFLSEFKEVIGDQKIDIVIKMKSSPVDRPIDSEARTTGILLI